jgi:hypothetical protein
MMMSSINGDPYAEIEKENVLNQMNRDDVRSQQSHNRYAAP